MYSNVYFQSIQGSKFPNGVLDWESDFGILDKWSHVNRLQMGVWAEWHLWLKAFMKQYGISCYMSIDIPTYADKNTTKKGVTRSLIPWT